MKRIVTLIIALAVIFANRSDVHAQSQASGYIYFTRQANGVMTCSDQTGLFSSWTVNGSDGLVPACATANGTDVLYGVDDTVPNRYLELALAVSPTRHLQIASGPYDFSVDFNRSIGSPDMVKTTLLRASQEQYGFVDFQETGNLPGTCSVFSNYTWGVSSEVMFTADTILIRFYPYYLSTPPGSVAGEYVGVTQWTFYAYWSLPLAPTPMPPMQTLTMSRTSNGGLSGMLKSYEWEEEQVVVCDQLGRAVSAGSLYSLPTPPAGLYIVRSATKTAKVLVTD